MLMLLKKLTLTFCFTFCFLSQNVLANFNKLTDYGANPGELLASYYANSPVTENLVILLHGCVQNGEQFAEQSGFLALAKRYDFTLLVPQQIESNNIKSCFNWFSLQDIKKDSGESLSLKNMISSLKTRVKAKNTYIVGLSAGGAMASVMLVHYPKMFSAGAIISGIPYPCADNLIKAISCMRSGPSQSVEKLTALVKQSNLASHKWPSLSIWTGKQDKVVHPLNSISLAKHWSMLTNSIGNPDIERQENYQVSRWRDQKDKTRVELIEIENMGHGIAVNPMLDYGGVIAPFLLETSISAPINIVKFWNIDNDNSRK
jgi:poly(hydroxyalkanoate) depolymerase family esterase